MHALDNAVYDALGSFHAEHALTADGARRYRPEVSPLSGVRDPADPACWAAMATLMEPGKGAGSLLWAVPEIGPRLAVLGTYPLVQMAFAAASAPPVEDVACRRLTAADADAMIALVKLTEPGPMERRTVELGTYLGVHDADGSLIAMSGERAHLPGWTEVSAVCTHPDHRGRGLARKLMALIMRDIFARGESPFLHVAKGNVGAQALYLKLGFTIRREGFLVRFGLPAA